ncbi:MAG: TerB family tellurite resistance protein [Planctomycetaceae bacterium]|nr:TerB family tellurite resistance protein [Planctomycetaceae bacterium]
MTQQEQIQYLANLYFLAGAGRSFEVEEDYVLQDIAKGIGAGYLETRKALDFSGQKDFQIKLPTRYSEKFRCLEDMLFLAMSDNKLDQMEKEIILTYSKKLGINQQQFDQIHQETIQRLKEAKKQ